MKSITRLQYINVIAFCGLLVGFINVNWSTLSQTLIGGLYKRTINARFDDGIPIFRTGNLADEYRRGCPVHQFGSVKIASRAPDIMLIEGFVTEAEASFLVKAAGPRFADSAVISGDSEVVDKNSGDSQTAFFDIPSKPAQSDSDVVISCIEERAALFQGHLPIQHLENLQAVKYSDTHQFRAHYDWLDVNQGGYSVDTAGNRATSFFVYLVANCTGGTTVFPQVDRPEGDAWCDTLKCKEDNGQEVEWLEVQGKVGRAIFWHNLDPYGNPDPDTLHAGTLVVHGTKVGLNIWTRENPYRQW